MARTLQFRPWSGLCPGGGTPIPRSSGWRGSESSPAPGNTWATPDSFRQGVTRARDGELRAFLNVCRHRGHVVANGSGTRETLQCPYHAWTYGLDGRLRAAPRSDREPGFEADELGLLQIGVDTWGPFVFVNPDPNADPLADALGDVPARLAEILDVDALEFRFRTEFELDVNWKVSCENFLECYHCAVAHPGFSAAVDVSPDAYRLEAHGLVSSQVGPLRPNGATFLADGEVTR